MQPLLRIHDLSVDFISEQTVVHALKNISLEINRGEVLALVGESGSGKSVTSLSILQLLPSPPAVYSSGQILFSESGTEYIDLLKKNSRQLEDIRGNRIAMIFQEPMTSLNPVLTCGEQVMEAIQLHKKLNSSAAREAAIEWFSRVKLPDPSGIFARYPHQLSGGQKQRVMIAMAMCCEPSLLICDEPTTALDVTVQKTILQLIRDLQQQSGMGVIFITHDLGVVAEIADRAAVMYQGEIVEQNTVQEIFSNPLHPYTRALLACRPVNHRRGERLPIVSDFLKPQDVIAKEDSAHSNKNISDTPISPEVLLNVKDLSVWFPARKTLFGRPLEYIKAVDDVSFDVYKGETLGLVGESGCGKTTLGRTLLRLVEPTKGKIYYKGIDLTAKKREDIRALRKDLQIVFQDPYLSLTTCQWSDTSATASW